MRALEKEVGEAHGGKQGPHESEFECIATPLDVGDPPFPSSFADHV